MSLTAGELVLSVLGEGDARSLRVSAPTPAQLRNFEGTAVESGGGTVLDGPLSAKNAAAVRASVPSLQPRPIGLVTSAGVGDRLGLATPGHALAFRSRGGGVVPVFAQQSAREMDRLGRTPQRVLDDATFGCVQAGWDRAVGADADHLKTIGDIDRCLDAGFTSFTIDPGELVRAVPDSIGPADLDSLPWAELEDDPSSMIRRYSGFSLDLGDRAIGVDEPELLRAAAKYAPAVAHAVTMYRHLMARADYPVEVEVAVDETGEPTSLAEHVYLVSTMARLGMRWVGFAPRYVGDFGKGVAYRGDLELFAASVRDHAAIARVLGPYKLSLHSGSDKFEIYEPVVEATRGLVHLKTSGTSYLEALRVAAVRAPALFREIYDLSRRTYHSSRSGYVVSADVEQTPLSAEIGDDGLVDLVSAPETRQVLHVGYGEVLTSRDERGVTVLSDELRSLLGGEASLYASFLEAHIGRHLRPFAVAL